MAQTSYRVIKNTGFLYLKMGVTMFISLYTTRLILNALGATDFGIFGIVGGAIAMLGFLNNSMSGATQRFMSYSQGSADQLQQCRVFTNSILLHWIGAIILALFLFAFSYPLFHGILNIPSERLKAAQIIYIFLIINTFITVISTPYDAAINAHENMGYYAVVGILESFIKLGIALYVVYTIRDKLIVYGLLMALLSFAMLLVKYIYCRVKYAECCFRLRVYCHKQTIKDLSGFAGWNFIDSIGSMIGNNGGDVVLNHFFGPSINAAGSVGSQLRGQMMAFSNGLLNALNPVISKKEGGGDRNGMLTYTLTGAKLSYVLFALFALPFMVDATYILKIWLKNVPEWAVCFSRFQMITALGEQMTITLGTAIAATGMIKNYSIFSGIAHVLPLFIYVLFYSLGAEPYWTYIITFINFVFVIGGYKIYQCHMQCNLEMTVFIKSIIIPCCICSIIPVIIGFGVLMIMEESFVRLCVIVLLIDMVLLILFYCYLLDMKEREYVNSLILKIKRR